MNEKANSSSALQVFNYEGNAITFQTGDGVMVNATEMAKQFGKRPSDWLNNQQTKDLINELTATRKSVTADLVQVRQGGAIQGTWLHEDLALVFAQWLSPKFYLWCNDRIKELLTQGVATVADDDAAILHAMQVLQRRVEERDAQLQDAKQHIAIVEELNEQQERQLSEAQTQIQIAEGQIEEQAKRISSLTPLAEYTEQVLQSKSTMTLTQAAMALGLRSVHVLTRFLKLLGVIYKQSNQWIVVSKYRDGGNFAIRKHIVKHDNGNDETKTYTVVTEKGLEWMHRLIENHRAQGFKIA